MNDIDMVFEIETRISKILDDLEQLAELLENCKNERGWNNFSDPITGKVCKINEALVHIFTAHSEIGAIDVCSCEKQVV